MAIRVTRAGVGLIIGIIILAAVIVGGLYLVRERGEQARRDDAMQVAQENSNNEAETGTIAPESEANGETATSPAEESLPGDTSGNGSQNGATNPAGNGATSPEQLPSTGPTETLLTLIIIGVMTYGTTFVIMTRYRAQQ